MTSKLPERPLIKKLKVFSCTDLIFSSLNVTYLGGRQSVYPATYSSALYCLATLLNVTILKTSSISDSARFIQAMKILKQ